MTSAQLENLMEQLRQLNATMLRIEARLGGNFYVYQQPLQQTPGWWQNPTITCGCSACND